MNDNELISALRNRQPDAFRRTVEAYQQRVINICYRFVQDRAEAEDLAQETFIEVYHSVGNFREQSALSTWIYRIAVTKSLDFIRRQNRAKRGGKLKALLRLGDTDREIPAPDSSLPDRILEQQEHRRVLQTALGSLPESQRVAFVLSQWDGVTYQEIAEILKTSVSSVESLIHRARKNLQKKLRDYYDSFYTT